MNVPAYTVSPASIRSAISHVVRGQIIPNYDWSTTIPIPMRCIARNHGFRTQDHEYSLPAMINNKPTIMNATKNTWMINNASAAKRKRIFDSIKSPDV